MRAARACQAAGALLLASGMAIGAIGAHVLKARLPADRFDVLQTAVLYQLVSGLGLLCIGLALVRVATAPRALGVLTPLGGLCLILGWIVVAVAAWRCADHG